MKALTVRQPWASLIAQGDKTIEIRSWRTNYRGPLLITASAKTDDPDQPDLPRSCTICLVNLSDCRPATDDDEAGACCEPGPDDYAWILTNPRPTPELPVKGKLSIWSPPPEILKMTGEF